MHRQRRSGCHSSTRLSTGRRSCPKDAGMLRAIFQDLSAPIRLSSLHVASGAATPLATPSAPATNSRRFSGGVSGGKWFVWCLSVFTLLPARGPVMQLLPVHNPPNAMPGQGCLRCCYFSLFARRYRCRLLSNAKGDGLICNFVLIMAQFVRAGRRFSLDCLSGLGESGVSDSVRPGEGHCDG